MALLAPGFADAWGILSRRHPSVVIGVGGYSSGPVVLLAALRGIATMVLEQNAVPGLTNRSLARFVRAAAVTYEETLPYFKGRGFVSGNPVRAEFFSGPQKPDFVVPGSTVRAAAPRLLVIGGSQGAHAINVAMTEAAAELARRRPDLDVVHQTGERDLAATREGYLAAGLRARIEAFLDPVAPEMLRADLVIARAGATTLAELAASGRPALLVPFPAATDDHQRRNAEVLVDGGAAVMLEEKHLTGETLASRIDALLNDPAGLAIMSAAMRRFARPDAAARIVDRLLEVAGVSGGARVARA
jgi:UDP-N-acetylglucosamine--N-acetylmuramyl-(pentapeptide) pyrophosphoryl-undecaprenol N-acetylglucosamine transferase